MLGQDPRPAVSGAASVFEEHRPALRRLAYRMLGSLAEAEDVVQDAFLRWHKVDPAGIRNPGAFLSRTVTRLCLDQLKSARAKREIYVGPWLPEPWLSTEDTDETAADDVTYHLMFVLERLSPLERAAFLLHDVFDVDFAEVAARLGRSEAACRQLAARARKNIHTDRPRFAVPAEEGQAIADAFHEAARMGEASRLQALLAENVMVLTDGGGRRSAALNPLPGRDRNIRFLLGLARKAGFVMPEIVYRGPIDGLPGLLTRESDGLLQATSFAIRNGVIETVYVIRNPEKLAHLAALAPAS